MDEGFARELRSTSSSHGLHWERALLVPSKSLEKKAPAAVGVGVVVVAGTVAGADDVGRGLCVQIQNISVRSSKDYKPSV
jgi:hypothetical protein